MDGGIFFFQQPDAFSYIVCLFYAALTGNTFFLATDSFFKALCKLIEYAIFFLRFSFTSDLHPSFKIGVCQVIQNDFAFQIKQIVSASG